MDRVKLIVVLLAFILGCADDSTDGIDIGSEGADSTDGWVQEDVVEAEDTVAPIPDTGESEDGEGGDGGELPDDIQVVPDVTQDPDVVEDPKVEEEQ